jgi:hypothetical protein
MSYQSISPGPRQVFIFRNKTSFYGEELSAPRPTPKLEDHPLSAFRNCIFNIFAATLHIGGRSSIRNLRTRHTVVTETHLSWIVKHTRGGGRGGNLKNCGRAWCLKKRGFQVCSQVCWQAVSIRKVLRPATSTQVFLGFPVSISNC